jgi:hypothetical protein
MIVTQFGPFVTIPENGQRCQTTFFHSRGRKPRVGARAELRVAEENKMRTSNVERRTSNFEVNARSCFNSTVDVRRSTFDVRIFLPFSPAETNPRGPGLLPPAIKNSAIAGTFVLDSRLFQIPIARRDLA